MADGDIVFWGFMNQVMLRPLSRWNCGFDVVRKFLLSLAVLLCMPHHALSTSIGVQELVVLRANDGATSQLNISHKGQLQAALVAGEYTVMPVCPGDVFFDVVAWATDDQVAQPQSIRGQADFDPVRQVMVLEVSPSGRIWASPQARDAVDWSAMTRHGRVTSRVVPRCEPMVVVPTAAVPVLDELELGRGEAPVSNPPVMRSVEVASDLLFPFASAAINRQQADAMLRERLRAVLPEGDVSRITGIRVIGHSDSVGAPRHKAQVSMQRAQEVANYLQSELGLPASLFSVESRSDLELRVVDCPLLPLAQRDGCNAPNRRVEVVIALQF